MNVKEIMAALAIRLATIDGLRAYGYPVESVSPPAAIVSWPSAYTFDATYGRGHDDLELQVVVVVGRPRDNKATLDRLSGYLEGAGPTSVKAALEAEPLPSPVEGLRVRGVEIDIYTIAGAEYVTAVFDVQVDGRGTV
jgi:hypothetical protein